MIFNKLLHNNL